MLFPSDSDTCQNCGVSLSRPAPKVKYYGAGLGGCIYMCDCNCDSKTGKHERWCCFITCTIRNVQKQGIRV